MHTTFSQRLRSLRRESGLSQTQLAEFLGVSQQSITGWENARTEPEYRVLIKIAGFFSVTSDYLLGLSDQPGPQTVPFPVMSPEAIRQIEELAEFLKKK